MDLCVLRKLGHALTQREDDPCSLAGERPEDAGDLWYLFGACSRV